MDSELRDFLAGALDTEFSAFLEALDRVPAAQFSRRCAHGHSAAWHALHITDWTRATIRPGLGDPAPTLTYGSLGSEAKAWATIRPGLGDPAPTLTYGSLGSEAKAWAQAVTGPTVAHESDPRDAVRAAVAATLREAVQTVRDAPPERFDPAATLQVLHKTRSVRGSLTYHLRHTAYHRGQLAHLLKELVHDPVPSLPA